MGTRVTRAAHRMKRTLREARRHLAGRSTSPLIASAEQAGWTCDERDRSFLAALESACARRDGVTLGVLVRKKDRGIAGIVTDSIPGARATTIRASRGTSRLHVQLAAQGPFDVLVDDTRLARARTALFRRSFLHLSDGGAYLVRAPRAGTRRLQPGETPIDAFLQDLVSLRDDESFEPDTRTGMDELALARSIGEVQGAGDHLVARKVGRSFAKLGEREANAVLRSREHPTGRVLHTVSGLVLRSRCVLRESASFRAGQMPTDFTVPDLFLRSYADADCWPGQIVTQGHLLLPDTYRHLHRKRLRNRFVDELAPRFGRPRALSDPTPLPGSYYYLDSEFRGHFGHALTEQVARFWGWAEAKQADPGLKALVAVNAERRELAPFERALFAAVGIEDSDIELIRRPVRVDRLVAATPMFVNPAYVHPEILQTWSRVGQRLGEQAPARSYPARVFCSRREQAGPGAFAGARRECRNAEELEAVFADHGFEVIHPEDYDLAAQARIFREAEVVAGYAGSALFNLIFCDSPKHVIVVSSESYTAKNEYVIASAAGHRVDIAWCAAEIPMPRGRWDTTAFNSPFSFDFDREGRFLTEVLESL